MIIKLKFATLLIAVACVAAFLPGRAFDVKGYAHEGDHNHDHSEFEYLYGNHYCPVCNYADLVDPHFYADISNKKARVYARVYLCDLGCAEAVKKDVGKYYMDVYRTDRETGKEKPAIDLKNANCPSSDDPVDGKTSIEYNGMIVHFCCEHCVEAFVKDPEPGMRKLLPEAAEYKWPGHEADHDPDHDHDHEKEDAKDQ